MMLESDGPLVRRGFGDGGWSHKCRGCNSEHYIAVEKPFPNGAKWSFNGDFMRPTFGPSIKITTDRVALDDGYVREATCCHYFIIGGMIQYLGDCTHALKGVTEALAPFTDEDRRYD